MDMEDEILEGFSIGAFFQEQESQGWMPDTKQRYAKCLYELRDFLAGKGPPGRELLNQWQRQLESRYSRSGVQVCLAAANGYFQWCGRPDLQLYPAQSREGEEGDEIPAVTREEYLKLLRAARTLGRQRSYLLVKLFATTGLPLQCLEQVTAEVVRQGGGTLDRRGTPVEFRCPDGLRRELLAYLAGRGILSGPVFVSRTGRPLNRSSIFRGMQELCRAAGVPEEKGNPSSLRKLYRATQEHIRAGLDSLQRQVYDQILEQEQDIIGWPTDENRLA